MAAPQGIYLLQDIQMKGNFEKNTFLEEGWLQVACTGKITGKHCFWIFNKQIHT